MKWFSMVIDTGEGRKYVQIAKNKHEVDNTLYVEEESHWH